MSIVQWLDMVEDCILPFHLWFRIPGRGDRGSGWTHWRCCRCRRWTCSHYLCWKIKISSDSTQLLINDLFIKNTYRKRDEKSRLKSYLILTMASSADSLTGCKCFDFLVSRLMFFRSFWMFSSSLSRAVGSIGKLWNGELESTTDRGLVHEVHLVKNWLSCLFLVNYN